MKGNLQLILKEFSFSFDNRTLKHFFKDLSKSLSINGLIDLFTFRNCFTIPYIITDKLFNTMIESNAQEVLTEREFIKGMTILYSKDHLKRLKLIFSTIDYNKDGLINISDVKLFLLHFHLMSNKGDVNSLLKTVDQLFKQKPSLSFNEMTEVVQNESSDAMLLLLFYFNIYSPIKPTSIEYYERIAGVSQMACEQEPTIPRWLLERKTSSEDTKIASTSFTTQLVNVRRNPHHHQSAKCYSYADIKSLAMRTKERKELNWHNPTAFLYEYLKDNFNQEYPMLDNLIPEKNDVADELHELNAFEEDIYFIQSSMSSLQSLSLVNTFAKDNTNKSHSNKKSNVYDNDYEDLSKIGSTRKSSFNSDEPSQQVLLLNLEKLPLSPLSVKLNLSLLHLFNSTSHNNLYFSDKCLYNDNKGNQIKTNITVIGNMLFLYQRSSYSKATIDDKCNISRVILLNKFFINDKETVKKDDFTLNCSSTIKGCIDNFTLIFETTSLAIECNTVISNITQIRSITDDYSIKEQLGLGTNGIVKRVQNKRTKANYAVKILPINYNDKPDLQIINEELDVSKLLSRVSHENILKVYDYYETQYFIYIIMEYIQGFTLTSLMKNNTGIFLQNKAEIVNQSLKGLNALQYYGIIHRDLKPDNVMTTMIAKDDQSSHLQLKLIDFGFAKVIFRGELVQQSLGTILYSSPEMLLNKMYNETIDLWSLGIILYQFVHDGNHPFFHFGDKKETIIKNIIEEEIDISTESIYNKVDTAIICIMKKCLERDSIKRSSVCDVLNLWETLNI